MKEFIRVSIKKYPITKFFLLLIVAEMIVFIAQYILPYHWIFRWTP